MNIKSSRGFTLIELLAVITILAIITGVAVPAIMKQVRSGKIKAARVQMTSIEQSLNAFNLDCGFFPTTEQGLEALISAPTVGRTCKSYDSQGYWGKKDIPPDPFNTPYIYRFPGVENKGSYEILSAGPDGIEGNEDDIKAWELPK